MPNYAPQSTARKDADISAAKSNLNPPNPYPSAAKLEAMEAIGGEIGGDFPKASS